MPSVSLLAEFPVAIVDKVVDKRGTRDLAKAYLDFLYTPEARRSSPSNGNRVNDEAWPPNSPTQFPEVRLVTVEDVFGGWEKVDRGAFRRRRPPRPGLRRA